MCWRYETPPYTASERRLGLYNEISRDCLIFHYSLSFLPLEGMRGVTSFPDSPDTLPKDRLQSAFRDESIPYLTVNNTYRKSHSVGYDSSLMGACYFNSSLDCTSVKASAIWDISKSRLQNKGPSTILTAFGTHGAKSRNIDFQWEERERGASWSKTTKYYSLKLRYVFQRNFNHLGEENVMDKLKAEKSSTAFHSPREQLQRVAKTSSTSLRKI